MKNFINEFKKFAMRGNVIDMAVGIIIGAAFGKIVDSLVKDIIMPPIGILLGKIDFANLFFVLNDGKIPGPYVSLDAAKEAGAVTMNVGMFINATISFMIVAFAVFVLIKAINTLQEKMLADEKKEEIASAPNTKKCPFCCSEIAIEAVKCPHCTSEIEATKKVSKKKTK
ncbi:MAG: large-conductance mechanosensitive channel protein MscL [Alphaproteobacteria bacterium]|nr:large-conductance mechanosensitive channel protein MscL [Alphaproteobacteria bacterium]